MVHQHFMLADNFTVLENVILGYEPTDRGVINVAQARKKILEMSAAYGLDVDPDALRFAREFGLDEPNRFGRTTDQAPVDFGA